MKFSYSIISAATIAGVLGFGRLSAEPADKAELETLRAQVQQLAAQLKVLSRQLEIKEEAATAAAPTTPKITVNDKGVTLASADGANSLKLRGLVQLDSRVYFGDHGASNNAFVLRRARIIAEGNFAKNFGYQVVPDFAGSAATIQDANITVALSPAAQLKVGKFKVPVGLEMLQSDSWTFFQERSLATNLVPNRDLGVQVSGDVLKGKLNYIAGVFGGVPDAGSTTNTDFQNEKELAGRLFASPFKGDAGSPVQGLSFGVGASTGRAKTTAGRTAGYRTDGQQTFFAYNSAVVADGQSWRVSPQFDYRNGSLGILGEYVVSTVNVRSAAGAPKTELQNRAWQIAAGYVLTGEDSSPAGVAPQNNFDWAAGTWGAFEIGARFADLKIDDNAFPTFASPATNADEAKAIGVGLNWYLSKTVRFTFDYFQTRFEFNSFAPAVSTAPILRQDEKAFFSRFQLAF